MNNIIKLLSIVLVMLAQVNNVYCMEILPLSKSHVSRSSNAEDIPIIPNRTIIAMYEVTEKDLKEMVRFFAGDKGNRKLHDVIDYRTDIERVVVYRYDANNVREKIYDIYSSQNDEQKIYGDMKITSSGRYVVYYVMQENITSLCNMFCECRSLIEADFTCFDGTGVDRLTWLFYGCSSLNSVKLGRFGYTKNRTLDYMFAECSALVTLDLNNLNTSAAVTMDGMFENCTNLKVLYIKNFHFNNVKCMSYMFSGCESLVYLHVPEKVISNNVASFSCQHIFKKCKLNTETKKIASFKDVKDVFDKCNKEAKKQKNVLVAYYNIKEHNKPYCLINGNVIKNLCGVMAVYEGTGNKQTKPFELTLPKRHLTKYTFEKAGKYKVTYTFTHVGKNLSSLFKDCSSLTYVDFSGFCTDGVTDMSEMFSGCKALESLDLSRLHVEDVTTMKGMFRGCSTLTELNLGSFENHKIVNMAYMFSGCQKLKTLNLGIFLCSSLRLMNNMFEGCSALVNLFLLNVISFSAVRNMSCMFKNCSALKKLDLGWVKTSHVISFREMFDGCENLKDLNIKSFCFKFISCLSGMFKNCKSLETLEIPNSICFRNWNIDVTYISEGCNMKSQMVKESIARLLLAARNHTGSRRYKLGEDNHVQKWPGKNQGYNIEESYQGEDSQQNSFFCCSSGNAVSKKFLNKKKRGKGLNIEKILPQSLENTRVLEKEHSNVVVTSNRRKISLVDSSFFTQNCDNISESNIEICIERVPVNTIVNEPFNFDVEEMNAKYNFDACLSYMDLDEESNAPHWFVNKEGNI